MVNNWIWNELEIDPTDDQRAIKRAYAKKSRQCHPEEKPEEFKRLHEAYSRALEMARGGWAAKLRGAEAQEAGAVEAPGTQAPKPDSGGGTPLGSPEGPEAQQPPRQQGEEDREGRTAGSAPLSGRDLDDLIARGLERDYAADPELLLDKVKKLHGEAKREVNRYTGQLEECLEQWRRLTESEHFQVAGWKPEFLEQLSDWLRENRDGINRAEAISLYNAYDFIHYGSRDYPEIPFIHEVYIQLMYQARRYEQDMLRYTGLPAASQGENRYREQNAGRRRAKKEPIVYGLMGAGALLCLLMIITIFIPPKSGREGDEAEPFAYSALHEAGEQHSAQWLERYSFCRAYPNGYRMSEAEAFGQRIAATVESAARIHIEGKRSLPYQVSLECVSEADATHPAVFRSETEDKENIAYYFTVQPSENGIRPPKVLTSGYLPEVFAYFCAQKNINCRVWYPAYDEVGLAVAWPEVERTVFLEYALDVVFEEYSRYAGDNLQPLNITVIYGKGADAALDALAEGTYEPSTSAVHPGYYVSTGQGENQFEPAPGFEDTLWVSHVVCGPENDGETVLYPGCRRFDVTKELLDHLEGLDWMAKMNYNGSDPQTMIKENER